MAAELRVLMLCPQFRPIVGGYERAAERLSQELVRLGCGVEVVAERRDRSWPAREDLNGLVIRRLPVLYRPGLHSMTSLFVHAAWLAFHGRRFDVWHVHQYGSHATLAILLGKLLRRPVVLKLTSSAAEGVGRVIASGRLSALQAWAHRRVTACIAVSAETAEEAQDFGIPGIRVVQIGNGVDTEAFSPATPELRRALRLTLKMPPNGVAVFVGRLSEEKNPLGLLEAWASARPRFRQPWTLVFVGDGPLRQLLEANVRNLNLESSVVLVGHSERVQDWLRAADLYVLSSHREGLSNTTLEAMATALPSVVTAVSGMSALIRVTNAGLVVPVGDVPAFAEALMALHDDPTRRLGMGRRARETVLRDYSLPAVAARHLAIYRSVVRQAQI